VKLGHHSTLIKDSIAAFNWEEIKPTVEINLPSYGHALLSTEEFVDALSCILCKESFTETDYPVQNHIETPARVQDYLDLCHTPIDEQIYTGDIIAVI
jgi:hypothetical protein